MRVAITYVAAGLTMLVFAFAISAGLAATSSQVIGPDPLSVPARTPLIVEGPLLVLSILASLLAWAGFGALLRRLSVDARGPWLLVFGPLVVCLCVAGVMAADVWAVFQSLQLPADAFSGPTIMDGLGFAARSVIDSIVLIVGAGLALGGVFWLRSPAQREETT